ncbi:MAG: archaellin/type IV pilin N-terminal domain-containing protein [Nanoarchaeota archaeon]|nr:archaellin/type IV pilin N-terminal domain-containing protein [Nanoarchaeota archaeon]
MRNYKPFRNKKALSPLVATILLVVFALVIGTITMSWGKSYVDKIQGDTEQQPFGTGVFVDFEDVDTPLKRLQIQYISGEITEEEYRQKEKVLNG